MERSAAGGYLHLLPTVVPKSMTATGLTASMLPWFAPAFTGMVGTTTDATPEHALAVTFEWPINWLRTAEPLGQFELESLYLRRFSSDQMLATRTRAFFDIQPGDNPPDATVQSDTGRRRGVESTALTIEGRRQVHGLFIRLRQRLEAAEPAVFSKLAGNLVYVWFDSPDPLTLGKPHKRSDVAALDALVDALAQYEPRGEQLWVPSGPLPEQGPELPVETSGGAKFYAVPLTAAAPSTILFTVAGFEIGLAYTTFVTAQTTWNEIQRLVHNHDEPGVDLLLVTAGGPDANGNVFPVEEAVADFALTHPLGLRQKPEYIKSVVLHSWASGQATRLYPDVRPIFGPLYHSMMPLHHPLAVATRPMPSGDATPEPGGD